MNSTLLSMSDKIREELHDAGQLPVHDAHKLDLLMEAVGVILAILTHGQDPNAIESPDPADDATEGGR